MLVGLQVCCAPTPRQRYERQMLNTGEPALHAVHSERLEEVMEDLSGLTLDRLPQEMDVSSERERHMDEIAVIARSLAETSAGITDAAPDYELAAAEREVFDKLTAKLHSQAVLLEHHAEAKDLPSVRGALDQITATCNACHSAFRQVPPTSG